MTADRRLELEAAPGVVKIELPESPTTGFIWQLVDPPSGVREIDRAFRSQADDLVAGGSGTRVFCVHVPQPGHYELEFKLRRPWEEEARERAVVVLDVAGSEGSEG
jgi:predicted secreted protein